MMEMHQATGQRVVDPQGQKIGVLTDVISLDPGADRQWAVVTHGALSKHHRVIPMSQLFAAADMGAETFVTNFDKDVVHHAPEVGSDHRITPQHEQAVREYYRV